MPGNEHYGLFFGLGEDKFGSAITTPNFINSPEKTAEANFGIQVSEEKGIEFSVEQPSPFAKLIDRVEPLTQTRNDPDLLPPARILDLARWLPPLQKATLQTPGRTDFVYLDDGSNDPRQEKQLHLLLSNGEKKPSFRQQSLTLRAATAYQLIDLNSDGLSDLLVLDEKDSSQTNVLLYLNRDGRFDIAKPSQVLRVGGYYVTASAIDIDNNGRKELLISAYNIGAMEAVRGGNVSRTITVYPTGDGDELFQRRPSARQTESFGAETILGLTDALNADVDIDGDGKKEALSIDEKGNLIARAFESNFNLASEPFWQFPAERLMSEFTAVKLNADTKSDFVLINRNGVTVLVSQP